MDYSAIIIANSNEIYFNLCEFMSLKRNKLTYLLRKMQHLYEYLNLFASGEYPLFIFTFLPKWKTFHTYTSLNLPLNSTI